MATLCTILGENIRTVGGIFNSTKRSLLFKSVPVLVLLNACPALPYPVLSFPFLSYPCPVLSGNVEVWWWYEPIIGHGGCSSTYWCSLESVDPTPFASENVSL